MERPLSTFEVEEDRSSKERALSVLSVFTSAGTLICCAMPAAISALAGGAALASLVSSLPWLIPVSANKGWIFLGAGVMLVVNGGLLFRKRPQTDVSCDASKGRGCEDAVRFSRLMFVASAAIYSVGVFFAYAIVPILRFLDA